MDNLQTVKIFTDGACSGNPGPGGWAAILCYNNNVKKITGSEYRTTNNRMELTALIEALKLLKFSCEVLVYSDSKYLVDSVNKGWLDKWHENNWTKCKKKEIINKDLWQMILELKKNHLIKFVWIRGHSGHPENEECDKLATKSIKDLLKKN